MVSFGRSSINRKFYLVSLCLLSKEETDDYVRLFEAFKFLCKAFGVKCVINFLMQDVCKSESAAAAISLHKAIVLMCYFHVTKNVKERLKGKKKNIPVTPEQYHSMILGDIGEMHYARTQGEFNIIFNNFFLNGLKFQKFKFPGLFLRAIVLGPCEFSSLCGGLYFVQ